MVLETRLNEVLRFSLGRTYGVTVQESFASAPPMQTPEQELPGTVTVRSDTEIEKSMLWRFDVAANGLPPPHLRFA